MTPIIAKANELYRALNSGDVDALRRLLSRDFRGQLSAGLPDGLGRTYEGLDAMLAEAWAAVDELLQLEVQLEQLFDGGALLIARGTYCGTARQTGKVMRAAFAHFWRFDGQQFTSLQQVTDTGIWRDALN